MEVLNTVAEKLSTALLFVAGVLLVLLMAHVVADVTMKFLFNAPINGTLEIVAWYYMVGIAFLPIGLVQVNRRHLTVEMFTMGLSERRMALVDAIVASLMIVYVAVLTYLVTEQAIEATRHNEIQDVTFFDMPVWPSRWMLPIAFATMSLVLVSQALIDFRYAITGRGTPSYRNKAADVTSE